MVAAECPLGNENVDTGAGAKEAASLCTTIGVLVHRAVLAFDFVCSHCSWHPRE